MKKICPTGDYRKEVKVTEKQAREYFLKPAAYGRKANPDLQPKQSKCRR